MINILVLFFARVRGRNYCDLLVGYELVGRYALRTLIFVVSISERVTIDKLDSHQIFESFTITSMPQIPPFSNDTFLRFL